MLYFGTNLGSKEVKSLVTIQKGAIFPVALQVYFVKFMY